MESEVTALPITHYQGITAILSYHLLLSAPYMAQPKTKSINIYSILIRFKMLVIFISLITIKGVGEQNPIRSQ